MRAPLVAPLGPIPFPHVVLCHYDDGTKFISEGWMVPPNSQKGYLRMWEKDLLFRHGSLTRQESYSLRAFPYTFSRSPFRLSTANHAWEYYLKCLEKLEQVPC